MTFWLTTSNETWALSDLSRDLIFHKIPSDAYGYYIKESLKIGRETAAAYKGKDIRDWYAKHALTIEHSEHSGHFSSMRFRAEIIMGKKQHKVILYPSSLAELYTAGAKYLSAENQLDFRQVETLHLAHEFFHFIEFQRGKSTNDLLNKVETQKILGIVRKISVLQTCEIAAHAFAQELLELPFYPGALDFMYLAYNGEMTVSDIQQKISEYSKLLK